MRWLSNWFLDNPVAANLLMAFILIAGFLSINSIRVESFPQIPPSQLTISVTYPGGTPEQIDCSITQRIENAISGVPGIKSVVSATWSGFAQVTVRKTPDASLEKLLDDVRNQVESIPGLPEKAERPRITPDEFGNLASFVIVHGTQSQSALSEDVLQQAAILVEQALKKHSAISKVTNLGKRKQQLLVQPNSDVLQTYGLTTDLLADKIAQWSLEYRSGELKTGNGRITLRGDGYANNLTRLKNIPVLTTDAGVVRLKDVANVIRGYQDDDSIVRYTNGNAVEAPGFGQPAIALMISTSQTDNLLLVSDAVKQVLSELQPQLPKNVQTTLMADMAPYITEQLDLLSSNAVQGLFIVLVILGIFLELKLAFWVALGIPVSLMGALWLMDMPQFNYSINDITLFGMILVLGVLVDDAVVVGESIHDARKHYPNRKDAARHGVHQVATATTFGVLTTIAAFSPMLWIKNELAQTLAGFSAVVIFALIFSLIESKFILPAHLSSSEKIPRENQTSKASRFNTLLANVRATCQAGLTWFNDAIYHPTLAAALRHKISTLLFFVSIMFIAWGGVAKGVIPATFFPEIPSRYGTLTVTMDQDAAPKLAQLQMQNIESAALRTSLELQSTFQLNGPAIVKHLISVEGAKRLEHTIELSREALEAIPAQQILDSWKHNTGEIEGSYSTHYSLADTPAGATAITIAAPSREQARLVAQELKKALIKLPGVENPFDDSQSGKRQLQITLNDRGVQLGLLQRDLASIVGGAFGELEIHRLLEQGEEVSVLVQFPEQARQSITQLQNTAVMLPDGSYINLGEISDFNFTRVADTLYRRNRDEVVTLTWRQNRDIASPESVWQLLAEDSIPEIELQYPGVKIAAIGEFAEITEVQSGFKKAMLITLLLIYILLAVPLKSYFQPLIIMSVIPFGFAGAILGHWLMDLQVSILSLFGMMAMTGVVINDSLVLMTRFNQLYRDGMPLAEALITSGKSRLQAIFLTTITTVCGLLPLLNETSETAQYLKPAAVSLVFGELLATPITLILIPVFLGLGKSFRKSGSDAAMSSAKNLA